MIKIGEGFLCISAGRANKIDMIKILSLFFILFFLTGCAKLEHLPELLTLKDLSNDRDQQDLYVRNHDESFERLVNAVKDKSFDQYKNKKSFLEAFGKPLVTEQVSLDGESLEKWLYRYTTRSFGSPKVYLYFDRSGKLKRWQYFSGENNTVILRETDSENHFIEVDRRI